MKSQRITIRIDDNLRKEAIRKADEMNISLSTFIVQTVEGTLRTQRSNEALTMAIELSNIINSCRNLDLSIDVVNKLNELEDTLWESVN